MLALLSSVPHTSVPCIVFSSVSASVVVAAERDDSLASLSMASLTAFLLNDLTALSDSSVKSTGERARLQSSTTCSSEGWVCKRCVVDCLQFAPLQLLKEINSKL